MMMHGTMNVKINVEIDSLSSLGLCLMQHCQFLKQVFLLKGIFFEMALMKTKEIFVNSESQAF
jgi:hypothetical protein